MNVRIHNRPTVAQKRVLREEALKEFDRLLDLYNRDVALQVFYILHFKCGFGQTRLQRFADDLSAMQTRNIHLYELPDGEIPWLCEEKLAEDGIDVKALLKEATPRG